MRKLLTILLMMTMVIAMSFVLTACGDDYVPTPELEPTPEVVEAPEPILDPEPEVSPEPEPTPVLEPEPEPVVILGGMLWGLWMWEGSHDEFRHFIVFNYDGTGYDYNTDVGITGFNWIIIDDVIHWTLTSGWLYDADVFPDGITYHTVQINDNVWAWQDDFMIGTDDIAVFIRATEDDVDGIFEWDLDD